ncbi:hypothetical protein ACHAXR_007544 [Thalassiosira sp. AJA248-18]
MTSSKIKAPTLASLRFASCIWFCANAMLLHASTSSGAFTSTNSSISRSKKKASTRCCMQLHLRPVDESTSTITDDAPATLTIASKFQIREAQYSDLTQSADLMTDGFYPELRKNPIMRPIRYLLELDRLQGNFPYEEDGRHYYLVAYDNDDRDGGGLEGGNRKVIGFCDIDGRIPKGGGSTSLLPFVKYVQRPQPYFSDLVVHHDHRRMGVASALMMEAERRAGDMGFEELYLGVRSTNESALRMYSKIGYENIIPSGDILAFLEVSTNRGVSMLRRSLDRDGLESR